MSKRGMRRASMRVRLAVAAAVLVGGGAAGVVVASASHGGAAAAESAGFTHRPDDELLQRHVLGDERLEQIARHVAHDDLAHEADDQLPGRSRGTRHILVIQRGTVVAVGRDEFAVQSANGTIKVWHVTRKTATLNVGGTSTGMSAMTGGTACRMPVLVEHEHDGQGRRQG